MENNIVTPDFEKVTADIIEFVDCAKRCLEPHNQIAYNIVMNTVEMMIHRIQKDGETVVNDIMTTIPMPENCESCEYTGNSWNPEPYDTSKIPDSVKSEIDDIVNDILKD